jgi:hypothetical protein
MTATIRHLPSRRRAIRPVAAHVRQFLIVLASTDPLVWRRIQVPESYSFWDLHVAVQDAMGWHDYHLHEFTVMQPRIRRSVRIGIPNDECPNERPCLAGWKVPIAKYFADGHATAATYIYDFGDNWDHVLVGEGGEASDPKATYLRCISGEGVCPPEDCGGVHGYGRFLEAVRGARHPEHRDMVQWVGGAFDPHEFGRRRVRFDDPRERWQKAFQHESP